MFQMPGNYWQHSFAFCGICRCEYHLGIFSALHEHAADFIARDILTNVLTKHWGCDQVAGINSVTVLNKVHWTWHSVKVYNIEQVKPFIIRGFKSWVWKMPLVFFLFLFFINFFFLSKKFKIHSKIEWRVQRFFIGLLPWCTHSLPHYQYSSEWHICYT